MSYYGTGDYYLAGDPGLLSSIGGFVKGAVGGLLTGGPIGAVTGGISGIVGRGSSRLSIPTGIPIPRFGGGGGSSRGMQALPGGRKRYRRMNVGNVKALNRANRRIDGFVKHAKKALKHTNYKVVSKSAGRSRSSGVITAAEAKRALRN